MNERQASTVRTRVESSRVKSGRVYFEVGSNQINVTIVGTEPHKIQTRQGSHNKQEARTPCCSCCAVWYQIAKISGGALPR